MENVKQINNTNNYFIHSNGYVFRIVSGKEKILTLNIIRGVPKVKIQNKRLNLVLLMIEYFHKIESLDVKYSFKIIEDKIPLKNIKFKTLNGTENKVEKIMFRFKCKEKASSNNSRVKFTSTITEIDVLNCLKRTNFKCFYCGNQLSNSRWHLDHVIPLSKGGLNSSTNITPSCKPCNMMKGAIPLEKFLFQISKIYEYSIKEKEIV